MFISVVTALLAGFLSFLSPCVLPLAASYLLFICGSRPGPENDSGGEARFAYSKITVIRLTFSFIVGFSIVFIVMSVMLYGLVLIMGGVNRILNIIAGSVIIVLGANILFNFIPFLRYDDRVGTCETCLPDHSILKAKKTSLLHPDRRPRGMLGTFIVGTAFGIGWTPCVGAFLGSILLMASQSGKMLAAVVYLIVYSIGLGIPFIITAVCWDAFISHLAKLRKLLPVLRIISGFFLIGIGVLIAADRFFLFNALVFQAGYFLADWVQTGGLSTRLFPAALLLVIALFPLLIRLLRKQNIFTPALMVFSGLSLILAILNAAGLINIAGLISRWLVYIGI
jgi:cytochrome c-type biogenesis protein